MAREACKLHDPRIHSRDLKVLLRIISTNKVNNHIRTMPIRSTHNPSNPIIGAVIKPFLGAELLTKSDLFVRAGGDEDSRRARGYGQLDSRYGDRGSARMEEDAVAGAEAAHEMQGLGGRYPSLRDAGGFFP